MKFNFDKHGLQSYTKCLKMRANELTKKYIESFAKHLYEEAPKKTGALASSFNISINVEDLTFDKNKTAPNFSIPECTPDDVLYISSGCPYLKYVNYGTMKMPGTYFIERAQSLAKQDLQIYIKNIGNTDF